MRRIYDRMYQFIFWTVRPILTWREPEILTNNQELIHVLESEKRQRVLIVSDKTLVRLKLLNPLLKLLDEAQIKYALYDDVLPNPTTTMVEEALKLYINSKCDALIGFGGGSPLDVAKAVAALLARPKKTLQQLKGVLKVRRKIPLLIAIPTTAGTGSEVTIAAVVIDEEKKHKYAINDPSLIPHYALLDPTLTLNLPMHITTSTGLDALTHAVEAYLNRGGTRYTNKKAINAVRLIFENLPKVYKNPLDVEARKNMQIAAYDAGVAFTRNYVGYVHALSHPLSAFYGLPHGYVNAVILPIMLEEYGTKIHRKLARLAKLSGVVDEALETSAAAESFIKKIKALNDKYDIKRTISKIKLEDISKLARYANKEARPLYPVPVLYSDKQLIVIYQKIRGI